MKKFLILSVILLCMPLVKVSAGLKDFKQMGCYPPQTVMDTSKWEYSEIDISDFTASDLAKCTEIDYSRLKSSLSSFPGVCTSCSWGGYITCEDKGCKDRVKDFINSGSNSLAYALCGTKYQCMSTMRDGTDGGLLGTDTDKMKVYCCSPDIIKTDITFPEDSFKGCEGIEDKEEEGACQRCIGTKADPTGAVWTEIGCIDPSPAGLITRIFQIGLGIMGGIAVLRFIQIAMMYQSGDAQKIQDARDGVTSLIAGLILLGLGIVILEFLGINILGLPEGFLGG